MNEKAEEATGQVEQADERSEKLSVDNLSMRQLIELDACTRCGECVTWCPVHDQDEREGVTPRSKATQLRKILRAQYGLFRADGLLGKLLRKKKVTKEELEQFAKDVYECSTCRQCHFVCPSQIDTVELWEGIRKSLVRAGYGPLETQKPLVVSVKAYDNPWQQPRSSRARWAKMAKKQKRIAEEPKDASKKKAEVLYFVGCTASYDINTIEVAINTVNILSRAGVDFGMLGQKEKCCGSVLLRMGDPEYDRIAGESIEQINKLGIKTLVTSCAGCFKTIKHDWPKAGKLNFEVKHMVEFLVDLVKEGKLKLGKEVKKTVTYHDPCHLGRHSCVYDAPREILKMIPGLNLVEMERAVEYSRCCGAGGGVKAGFPDIQDKMSQRRIEEAEAAGAEELVSACPFCYQGLQVGIQAMNSSVRMRDITELVAEAME